MFLKYIINPIVLIAEANPAAKVTSKYNGIKVSCDATDKRFPLFDLNKLHPEHKSKNHEIKEKSYHIVFVSLGGAEGD